MLDLTKPIQTRDGRAARVITTKVTPELIDYLESRGAPHGVFIEKEDVIAAEVTNNDGQVEINGYGADGRFMRGSVNPDDLVNVAPEPVRTSEFRLFQPAPRANRDSLGNFRTKTKEDLRPQLDYLDNMNRPVWAGIIEIIREDDEVVDVKFHPKEPSE